MKPLKTCPVCHYKLVQKHQGALWQEFCANFFKEGCPIKFIQTFASGFEDEEISSYQFYTEDFNIHCYFNNDKMWAGKTYVYHRQFPRGEYVMKPFLIVDNFPIDFSNLEPVNWKFKKWLPFA